jgi:Arm DNA-binding domain/Phage integrase family
MPVAKITDTAVRMLSVSVETYLWDDQLTGFGLRAVGRRKVFVVKYALGGRGGRQRKVKLGAFPTLNATQARAMARDVLRAVAHGDDPAASREERRNDLSLDDIMTEFLRDHVEAKRKTRTHAEYARLAAKHVQRKLGHLRVRGIETADVARLHDSLRGTPVQANRVLSLLSKLFSWCEGRGYRAKYSNPCRGLERFPEKGKERFLAASELKRLSHVLKESEEAEWPTAIAALRLLMFTGARKSEVLGLRWDDIDIGRGIARVHDGNGFSEHLSAGACTRGLGEPAKAGRQPFRNLGPAPRNCFRGSSTDLGSSPESC